MIGKTHQTPASTQISNGKGKNYRAVMSDAMPSSSATSTMPLATAPLATASSPTSPSNLGRSFVRTPPRNPRTSRA
ncbi:60S ribosomal protein L27 [Senna tora]|uniref:60S ribosomal protein L27 n=1 Tax=Senna tora TaxID=362788 RepID=A0A834WY50_9FABA|nr:60S ribosomal protein L27 [Senna tora]